MFKFNKKISKDITDEQLMLLIGNGNKEAFEILYARYFDKLVWFAQGFVGDLHKAEDAVQELFLKIIENPGKFDSDRKFSTWAYTVTGNTCKNILRNEQNRNRILNDNEVQSFVIESDKLDTQYLQQCIKIAFNELNDKEKKIFVLRFEQELSIIEISEILNLPIGSVKSGIYYLLKKLAYHVKDFKYEK